MKGSVLALILAVPMLLVGCGDDGGDVDADSGNGAKPAAASTAGNAELEEEIEVAIEIAQGREAVQEKSNAAQRRAQAAIRRGERCLDAADYQCTNRESALAERENDRIERFTAGIRKLGRLMNRLSPQAIEAGLESVIGR